MQQDLNVHSISYEISHLNFRGEVFCTEKGISFEYLDFCVKDGKLHRKDSIVTSISLVGTLLTIEEDCPTQRELRRSKYNLLPMDAIFIQEYVMRKKGG